MDTDNTDAGAQESVLLTGKIFARRADFTVEKNLTEGNRENGDSIQPLVTINMVSALFPPVLFRWLRLCRAGFICVHQWLKSLQYSFTP